MLATKEVAFTHTSSKSKISNTNKKGEVDCESIELVPTGNLKGT